MKKHIRAADAVLFVTPEYNRSIPGVLKNAIDAASRPYGDSAWQGKPAAVLSVSTSALGGFGSNHHLRQSHGFPRHAVHAATRSLHRQCRHLFDESGKLKKDDTREFFATVHAGLRGLDRNQPQKMSGACNAIVIAQNFFSP